MDVLQFLAANSGAISINGSGAYNSETNGNMPIAAIIVKGDATTLEDIRVNGESENIYDQFVINDPDAIVAADTILRPPNGGIFTYIKFGAAGSQANLIVDSSNNNA